MTEPIARRLAARLEDVSRALLWAPPAFLAHRIAARAVKHLAPTAHRVHLPGDRLPDEVDPGDVVLIHLDSEQCSTAELRDLLDATVPLEAQVLVVAERELCDGGDLESFDLVLGHQDLVLTESEISALHPQAADPVVRHSIMHVTGGVPSLAAVPYDDPRRYGIAVEEAAGAWAREFLSSLVADELLRLQATLGRVGEETMLAVARELLGGSIKLHEVCELRQNSTAVTRVGSHYPAVPDALASATRRLAQDLYGEPVDRWLADVLRAADVVAPEITGLERIRVFAKLGAWERVDRVMSTSMHLLVHASAMHQQCARAAWPRHFPPSLKYLARGRRYLDGLERPVRVGSATPSTWLDLAYLLSSHQSADPRSLVARVRTWFDPLVSGGRPVDLNEARRRLLDVAAWLLAESATGISRDRRLDDDSALLAGLLVGATDAGLLLGELGVARGCSAAAVRISSDMGGRMDEYSGLRRGVIVRAALIASHGALPRVAKAHLAEAERCRVSPEPIQDDLASLADGYTALDCGLLRVADAPAATDPDREWAPHEATIRALAIALEKGPQAGAQWASSMLQRASWAARPDWEWWPLSSVLVMLLLRSGRTADAASVLDRAGMPGSLRAVLAASVECAAGRTGAAAAQLDQALRADQLSNRWRIVGTGVKIACLLGDQERAGEVEALVDAQDWGSVLGALAVLPEATLRILTPVLGERAKTLEGLLPSAPARATGPSAVLTPRQRDILQALAEGGTMRDVANRLLVSTETVRSTAKAAYRRLGAGDRGEAVSIARARGII